MHLNDCLYQNKELPAYQVIPLNSLHAQSLADRPHGAAAHDAITQQQVLERKWISSCISIDSIVGDK